MESPTTTTFIGELRGQQLGPYQLEDLLGRGGMAVVYKALGPGPTPLRSRQSPPGVLCARGSLPPRFRKEAGDGGPSGTPQYSADLRLRPRRGKFPTFVMPLVSGGTLRQWLSEGPTLDRALRVFSHLLSALDYAHTRQPSIVHRDLKPSNVLMSHGGAWPLLTDFGIAKIVEPSMQLTRTGMMVGTPSTWRPSRAKGVVWTTAPMSTRWASAFEILTRHVPFQGQTRLPSSCSTSRARYPRPAR